MKDILEILSKLGIGFAKNIVYFVGMLTILLLTLSYIKEYNFITKYIVTLFLTH